MIWRDGVVSLTDEQRRAIHGHHETLLGQLAQSFDIGRSQREKQFSLGMRIASFLGALALAASVCYFFSQYMIALGRVRLTVERSPGQKPRLSGMIESLDIQEVNVPLEYRPALDPLLAENSGLRMDRPPRYTVRLIVGRQLEPWIKEVSTL